MTTLPEIVNWLEADESLHLSRLIILLDAFGGREGNQAMEGITKLAKLDFLLRYPAFLERALVARKASDEAAKVEEFERGSVEARMVRFRYGPWDFRYRRFLNILVGRGFAEVQDGRPVRIKLTQRGRDAAKEFQKYEEYLPIRNRALLLKRHLDLSATNLMEFVYATFPEIVSMRMGETIET